MPHGLHFLTAGDLRLGGGSYDEGLRPSGCFGQGQSSVYDGLPGMGFGSMGNKGRSGRGHGPASVALWIRKFLGDRARSFADDLARYLPGGAPTLRADLARLSDELLRLKVTAADVEHARRRPSDPTLAAWIHRLRDAAHDADDLLDDS
ncbi:hypothetical protein ZWY2020_032601 [Hordeum vulgare]|nr:hypothetical protein ZWY2020_032601 [Hordeum vulgare]